MSEMTLEDRVLRVEQRVAALQKALEGRVVEPPIHTEDLAALAPGLPVAAPPPRIRIAARYAVQAEVLIPASDREAVLWDDIRTVTKAVDALNGRAVRAWAAAAEEAKRGGATTMALPKPYFWSYRPTGEDEGGRKAFTVWNGTLAPRFVAEGTAVKIESLLQGMEE